MQRSKPRRFGASVAAALALGLGLVAPAAQAAPRDAPGQPPGRSPGQPPGPVASTTVPGELGFGALHTSRTTITVPAGIDPVALTGALSMSGVVTGGTIQVLLNGRTAASYPTKLYRQVRVPIHSADELADGTVVVALTYHPPPGLPSTPATTCIATPPPDVSLRKMSLTYEGTETAPTTLGEFFSPAVTQIDVLIPPKALDDLIEAGLDAVAALSTRYPAGVPITLGTTDEPPTKPIAGERVVQFTSGGTAVSTDITDGGGVPTLSISGTGDPLAHAAEALGSPELVALADSDVTQGLLTQDVSRDVGSTRTLTQLGIDDVSLSTQGAPVVFTVAQDSFGGASEDLRLRLVGAHTAVSIGEAPPLNVYVNGTLVDSVALTDDATLDEQVAVPADLLTTSNTIALALGDITCASVSGPPVQVSIDDSRSEVTSRPDTSPFGLQQFPQVFDGNLQLALRSSGPDRTPAAQQAAGLIEALQRAGAGTITVDLVSGSVFLASRSPGLLVGADDEDSVALQAPLQLTRTRQVDGDESSFVVDAGTPYAALESLRQNGRSVLMFGGWSDDQGGVLDSLLDRLVSRVGGLGWSELTGDLFVMTPGGDGKSFTSTPHKKLKDKDIKDGGGLAKYFLGVIVLILLVVLVQVVVYLRRRGRPAAPTST